MVFNPLRTFIEIVARDEQGVGDLVVTVMDKTTPVPLMRYCTGDKMQFIDFDRLNREAGAVGAGWRPPSLPVVALHGRAKDRLPNGGHVDLFKETLYRFPEVARRMTGAHRISVEGGEVRWEVQAIRGAEGKESSEARLQAELAPRLPGSLLRVEVLGYDAFPHGKTIDYERKFVYWVPPVVA